MKNIFFITLISAIAFSCSRAPEDTGLEFSPNMYVSHALDPLTKTSDEVFPFNPDHKVMAMIEPVEGTISRGNIPFSIPKDSFNLAATVKNPIVLNDKVKEEGAELYARFCKHCHGANGDGDGPVAAPSKFPGVAKLSAGQVAKKAEGQIFHALTYGRGRMGSHASQLSQEERWKIVHHVISLRK